VIRWEWEPWLLFFLRCLVRQKKNLNLKIEIERQTLERTSPLGAAVVRLLEDTDRITLAEAVKGTGANRNTLKVKINELVETGVLERHGRGRGVFYTRIN
jgi:Fic family protein